MRILVTGGRTFRDRPWLWAGLDLLNREIMPITEIIEGGAQGADVIAQEWAKHRGIKCTTVEAEWEKHGRSAGAIRNAQMASMNPDLVLACPGGRGTENMIATAQKRGLQVTLLEKMPVVASKTEGDTTGAPPSLSAA